MEGLKVSHFRKFHPPSYDLSSRWVGAIPGLKRIGAWRSQVYRKWQSAYIDVVMLRMTVLRL